MQRRFSQQLISFFATEYPICFFSFNFPLYGIMHRISILIELRAVNLRNLKVVVMRILLRDCTRLEKEGPCQCRVCLCYLSQSRQACFALREFISFCYETDLRTLSSRLSVTSVKRLLNLPEEQLESRILVSDHTIPQY